MIKGLPYVGSKARIAVNIIEILPSGRRFVDLFAGGGSVSVAAAVSKKYDSVLYNDTDKSLVKFFKDSLEGKYNSDRFEPTWISRETFQKNKKLDPYVAFCWSFGSNGENYLFGEKIESLKKIAFDWVVNGIDSDLIDISTDLTDIRDRRLLLKRWAKKSYKDIIKSDLSIEKEYIYYKEILSHKKPPLNQRLTFTSWLKSTGITRREIAMATGTLMASKYLDTRESGQATIPTENQFNRLLESTRLQGIEVPYHIKKLVYDAEKVKDLTYLDQLRRLDQLRILKDLQCLEKLETLESLSHLDTPFEFSTNPYNEYNYLDGDIVYCDIPYEGTRNFRNQLFDHDTFYIWARNANFPVFFSSYEAPNDFYKIEVKEINSLFKAQPKRKNVTECIFLNRLAYDIKN